MKYWLIKSEADCYSIDDLKKDRKTAWAGVRNFQARNFMRDGMKKGDVALFYHSNSKPLGIAGLARVASAPYADPTAFDKKDEHYDERSDRLRKEAAAAKKPYEPTWMLVDFSFVKKFPRIITLGEMKNDPALKNMMVCRRGDRLSVQPVAEKDFLYITEKLAR